MRAFWRGALLAAAVAGAAGAQEEEAQEAAAPNLAAYLDDALLEMVFPGADSHGPVEGDPPAAAAYADGALVGYIYEQYDVIGGVGYSKRPFHLVIGLGLDGIIAGARLTMHVEPIAILGRTDDDFHNYLTQFPGIDVRRGVSIVLGMSDAILEGEKFAMRGTAGDTSRLVPVDAVSRTTTSSILFSDSIIRAARRVARSRGVSLGAAPARRGVDFDAYAPRDWSELVAEGSVGALRLTVGDVAAAFAELPDARAPRKVRLSPDEDVYAELYVALVSPPSIGVNVLGRTWYDQYVSGRGIDDLILLVATGGGLGFQDPEADAPRQFARLRFAQDGAALPIGPDYLKTLPFLHAKEGPELTERGLFFYAPEDGLDPGKPWRFELAVAGEGGEAAFPLEYRVPEHALLPEPEPEAAPEPGVDAARVAPAGASGGGGPDWRPVWEQNRGRIALLAATLAVLLAILTLQDPISRRPALRRWLRIAFLAWVLGWLGWFAGAQLTVLGLLNIAQSLESGFDWAFFMVEPLIFILTAFVFVTMFLWGRAVFCGWLCPFGALQELLNKAAVALKIPQLRLPDQVQERLFALKYAVFLALLVLTFFAYDLAIAGSNVEPFKAAITFRFDAPAAAVAWAVALLAAGLFVERFYCRFLCPLGAGLAILGRVRMFDWLKRRAECGNPCHRCEAVCPTGAIRRSGRIDMNECFYCLDCQVTYYDDHQCPPLVAQRKRLESLAPASGG